ncbi:hypothetical protein UlMin_034958 [Ulmus minor]
MGKGLFRVFSFILLVWFAEANSLTKHKILEVERKINRLRKHIVKSIQSEDGDIIDCIDIYKQPALDHHALRNHTIQMKPTFDPTTETKTTTSSPNKKNEELAMTVTQLWKKRGSCPKGTIPVRRIRKRELLKANSIDQYGRKRAQFNETNNLSVQLANHSKAILIALGYRYLGAQGDIRVFNPSVEKDDEYSSSQVGLITGPYYDFESIESGWAVNPRVYGDRQTRFFTYWTADASNKTGCFDLTCSGFVQISNEIALGAALHPISVLDGLPYEITIYIFKDPITSNWWVQYGEKINIGYWPPELFESLGYNAESVEWGGEVYRRRVGQTPHTATQMGSGKFADYAFGDSGVIKRMRIHDNSASLKIPEWVETFSDEYNCYDVQYLSDYLEDPEFYYGGPGRNLLCP